MAVIASVSGPAAGRQRQGSVSVCAYLARSVVFADFICLILIEIYAAFVLDCATHWPQLALVVVRELHG